MHVSGARAVLCSTAPNSDMEHAASTCMEMLKASWPSRVYLRNTTNSGYGAVDSTEHTPGVTRVHTVWSLNAHVAESWKTHTWVSGAVVVVWVVVVDVEMVCRDKVSVIDTCIDCRTTNQRER